MKILSFNPGHDGSIAYLDDARLVTSIEAEKNSHYRYSCLSVPGVFAALGEIEELPDVLCQGGWWPSGPRLSEQSSVAEYHGLLKSDVAMGQTKLFGKAIKHFSSSHERSHLVCAFGMSPLPKGTPCYALLWEGVFGSFYEIDSDLNLTKLPDVMHEPGHRYALLYALADPTFDKRMAEWSRFSDAGKLMALASFSTRSKPSREEEELLAVLLQDCQHLKPSALEDVKNLPYYNSGLDDPEFRNFAGIFSDAIFDRFYQFAHSRLKRGMPLLIAGGCGLNCDWNSKWKESGLFSDVFVPPVANDSGSAIGTAIDAQFLYTGNPKIAWDVYSGLLFDTTVPFETAQYDLFEADNERLADMLANDLILAWVNGKNEIGPRALGNRSILAAPFQESTRVRLNEIKQREPFRPVAPVCLEKDALRWFNCGHTSPFMLYTYPVTTHALAAVTHVNRTARIQTVSPATNKALHELLTAFKARTGFGVLCNTSLNFNGRGFINNIADLCTYTLEHNLDGFVVEGRSYLLKSSSRYQAYLMRPYSV